MNAQNSGNHERTIGAIYKRLKSVLSQSDARYVLSKRARISANELITQSDALIDDSIYSQIESDLEQVVSGKPLSRIYGEREFWGLNFKLSDATLDPRQDTETLIEAVLARFEDKAKPYKILDLGTGSGCILLSLLSELPNASGVGVDIAPEAVKTAQENAQNLGLENRSSFICGSWDAANRQEEAERFDILVSNPPYISNQVIPNLDENVQKYDPILALDGGDDGMDAYKTIFIQLPEILKKGGYGFFEIGFDQEDSMTRLSKESRFSLMRVHRDSSQLARVVEIFFE